MANVNSPFGLYPLRHRSGGVVRANGYPIASGQAGAIYSGDPVKRLDTGKIAVAAAGDILIGVFQGVYWIDADGTVRFEKILPTGQVTQNADDAKAYVYDDPNIEFLIQTDATGYAITNNGNNVDIVYAAGSTLMGRSAVAADMTAPGSATAQLRILEKYSDPRNELGAYARISVLINEHELKSVTGV